MDPILGQICMFGFNWAPRQWALCNGQLLSIAEYSSLFSLIGTTYGGDGVTNFGLPNLQGRVPVHQGHGPGLSHRIMGQADGTENVALNVQQMASHSHPITLTSLTANLLGNDQGGDSTTPRDCCITTSETEMYSSDAPDLLMQVGSVEVDGTGTCQSVGGNQAHNNMQPFMVVNYCICVDGIYPDRP